MKPQNHIGMESSNGTWYNILAYGQFQRSVMFVCVPYLVCLILCLCLRLRLRLSLLDSAFVDVGDMLCKEWQGHMSHDGTLWLGIMSDYLKAFFVAMDSVVF